jgi:hypothetical protein
MRVVRSSGVALPESLMSWALVIAATAAAAGVESTEPTSGPAVVSVFPPGMNGVARYRIPGIVVTPRGTVLAYAEARRNGAADWGEIEVHLRRSTDGGRDMGPFGGRRGSRATRTRRKEVNMSKR